MVVNGETAFSVMASQLWNSLPRDAYLAPTLSAFKNASMAELFRQAFNIIAQQLEYVLSYSKQQGRQAFP